MEILFPILICIVVAELLISGSWQPVYFRFGIPLFISTIEHVDFDLISSDWLREKHVHSFLPPVLFKRLSDSEIAFRETMLPSRLFHYTPVMHGMIKSGASQGTVAVIGYANWFALTFCALFIVGSLLFFGRDRMFPFAAFGAGLFCLLYAIQFARFRRVANLIREHYCT